MSVKRYRPDGPMCRMMIDDAGDFVPYDIERERKASDYDALSEKHREMAISWCKDEVRHIRDREMARMEADKYKAALQMIVKLFENEDFMDESSDILDVLEIAERALK